MHQTTSRSLTLHRRTAGGALLLGGAALLAGCSGAALTRQPRLTSTPAPVPGASDAHYTGIDVVAVVHAARAAVVNVSTGTSGLDQSLEPVPAGTGTGVIYDARGYILTNSHVIHPHSGSDHPPLRVTLTDDRGFDAVVVDDDPVSDLAILKIEAAGLHAVRLGDSDRLEVGEPVVAIGHALALPGGPTVSAGIVSALDRVIDWPDGTVLANLIQTDAAINPGNSGGPLLNAHAEVVGINTSGIPAAEGISFAIAINQAAPAAQSAAAGRVVRPYAGVSLLGAITPSVARATGLPVDRGVMVRPVPDSPAARAGLREGDVVMEADGLPVRTASEFLAAVRRHRPGEELRLRLVRPPGTVLIEATIALVEAPR
jgi:S1-C subfamily serine protease